MNKTCNKQPTIIKLIETLKDSYIQQHGPICCWSTELIIIFSLNSDIQIESFAEKNNIEICQYAKQYGLTKGILFLNAYILMEMEVDEEYGKTIEKKIHNFLTGKDVS